ncbi:MAG: hypothetical protein JRH01_02210 [Deltaproteobacteria bacterium]|nr:hypothetical protein [Deltaproteobacteria bacterium]MBW2394066.1 hypothetical protein [Deltaproteobacteria bacterium]
MAWDRIGWRLFVTCWVMFSLHFATNIAREYYPAFSLAERGTLRVDPYVGLHPDLFEIEGRGAFMNNNPGTSIPAALPYLLARPIVEPLVARVAAGRAASGQELTDTYEDHRPLRRKFFKQVREQGLDVRFGLASGVIQLGFTAPLSALAAVVVRAVLLRMGFGAAASLGLALLYAFGTPIFFRTGFINQNLMVSHLALFSFACLYRPEGESPGPMALLAAGFLAGYGLFCDYSGLVPIVVLGAYALAKLLAEHGTVDGLRRSLPMLAGGIAGCSLLLAYQGWAFGNPFFPAQHYMPTTEFSGDGWNGVHLPALDLALQNLIDPRFGLFTAGTILLAAFAAPFVRRGDQPRLGSRELATCFAMLIGIWLFASSVAFARLQWNTGVRYLMPAIPFLIFASAQVWVRMPSRLVAPLAAAALLQGISLAMVRETPVESLATVLLGGAQLPWLTVLGKMGSQYVPFFEHQSPDPTFLILLVGLALGWLWWPLRSRARFIEESTRGNA